MSALKCRFVERFRYPKTSCESLRILRTKRASPFFLLFFLVLVDPLMLLFNRGSASLESPTGNSANGVFTVFPNCLTFGEVLLVKPLITPIVVSTNSGSTLLKLGKVKNMRLMETKRSIQWTNMYKLNIFIS